MLQLLRFAMLVLESVAIGGIVLFATSISVPPAPRLGPRGAARRHALAAGGLFASAEPILRFVAAIVALVPARHLRARYELELRRAGYCLGLTAEEYGALSIISASLLGGISWGLARAASGSSAFAAPGFVLGLILPQLQVREIIRRRVKEISRALPHNIEIAAMCMGAGLDFPGALRLLSATHSGAQSPLAREFAIILDELELGHTRREALVAFAERVPSPAVRDFVNAVVQAEEKGNPLAKVLQVQGRMLNLRRSVAAEEAATRAGVLMIAPMVLLLCCILLLLMGPFLTKGIGF